MVEIEKTKKLHPIVMLNYVPRFSGHFFACITFITTLIERGRPISIPLIFAALEGIIWPHFALFMSMRSKRPKPLELRMLFIDSYLLGLWIAYLDYAFWPSFTAVSMTMMANLSVRGLWLGLQSFIANVLGALTGSMLFGFHVNLGTGLIPNVLSAMTILVFSNVMGYMTYYRAKMTKLMREKLKSVNQELEESLVQLQRSKAQLVQSEKMAGIGQLIAGISHEINTPAGAIASAIEEINTDYLQLLNTLIKIVDSIEVDLRTNYFEVCSSIPEIPHEYGTMEIRNIASGIEKILMENDIANARMTSKNLATIGFKSDQIEKVIPLLKSSISPVIFDSLFMLGMTRIHTRDIKIAIQKILHLVKALKLFSRSDQGEFVKTNLEEDITTTLIILNNRLKHGITIIKEFDPIPSIECVAERLNQVWLNMVNNAIEAMKGKGQIIIRLKLFDENHVKVEFEDNGPGIQADVLSRIFEAYYTTKPKGEGTGLGLYISNEIVTKHSGRIEVDTQETGTLFRIILPIKGTHEK